MSVTLAKRRTPNVTGRRGKLTQARLGKVVDALATGGTVRDAARAAGITDARTIYSWMERSEDAREAILSARSRGSLAVSERVLERVYALLDKGDAKSVAEAAKHLRWHLSKIDPRAYGERHDRGSPVIAVQINTNALGKPDDLEPTTFHLEARIPIDAEFSEVEQ